jgi:hypothetical protein
MFQQVLPHDEGSLGCEAVCRESWFCGDLEDGLTNLDNADEPSSLGMALITLFCDGRWNRSHFHA